MSEPRAWECDSFTIWKGVSGDVKTLPTGHILVACDRRDVLLRWTDTVHDATHLTMQGKIYLGDTWREQYKPYYTAIPVASLLQSEAEKAWEEHRKTTRSIASDADLEAIEKAGFIAGFNAHIEIGRKGERCQ